jgi:hypothetical protein
MGHRDSPRGAPYLPEALLAVIVSDVGGSGKASSPQQLISFRP